MEDQQKIFPRQSLFYLFRLFGCLTKTTVVFHLFHDTPRASLLFSFQQLETCLVLQKLKQFISNKKHFIIFNAKLFYILLFNFIYAFLFHFHEDKHCSQENNRCFLTYLKYSPNNSEVFFTRTFLIGSSESTEAPSQVWFVKDWAVSR